MVDLLAECLRRASRARHHEHMVDLMALARMMQLSMSEAEIFQAKLKAEE